MYMGLLTSQQQSTKMVGLQIKKVKKIARDFIWFMIRFYQIIFVDHQ